MEEQLIYLGVYEESKGSVYPTSAWYLFALSSDDSTIILYSEFGKTEWSSFVLSESSVEPAANLGPVQEAINRLRCMENPVAPENLCDEPDIKIFTIAELLSATWTSILRRRPYIVQEAVMIVLMASAILLIPFRFDYSFMFMQASICYSCWVMSDWDEYLEMVFFYGAIWGAMVPWAGQY